jgi:murein endopeptidase
MESIRMHDAIEQAARAAAQRLAGPQHPTLAEDVEEALATQGAPSAPGQYADPTALGGLIVAIANTAWMIYNDIRSRSSAAPDLDALARRVRQQLDQADIPTPPLGSAERDRIVTTTVEETLNAADDQGQGQG